MRTITVRATDEDGNELDAKKMEVPNEDAILHVNYQNSRGTTLVIKKSEDYE